MNEKRNIFRRWLRHPIWHYDLRLILRMVEDQWNDGASPLSVVSSFPPMQCGHDGYWRTTYGNCMACRAETAERSNAVLQNLVENKIAYANQLRIELNRLRAERGKY